MYKQLIRPLLFLFDPEKVHAFTFSLIKIMNGIGLGFLFRLVYRFDHPKLERNLFGMTFPNPVGLAAGFDKEAKLFDELSNFGFGFIEIGTITPKAQPGNPKKRLFRLKEDQALINRMGFNNEGVEAAARRLRKKGNIIVGGNIGKNKMTPNNRAVDDYMICFEKLFDVVDYFVVNVSSPNTPDLRALQDKEPLKLILNNLMESNREKRRPKPILLKIAPDLSDEQLLDIIDIVESTGIDGVIATNTTIDREGLISSNKKETGGLSGKPLASKSSHVIRFIAQNNHGSFPIIGVGGIHSVEDALEKLAAGASLIQLYTGFIYEGPGLIRKINKAIASQ